MIGAAKEPILREGMELLRKARPKGNWWAAVSESFLGECLTALGRHEEAERLLLESYAALAAAPPTPPQEIRWALDRLVKLYESWGRADEVKKWRAKRKATSK